MIFVYFSIALTLSHSGSHVCTYNKVYITCIDFIEAEKYLVEQKHPKRPLSGVDYVEQIKRGKSWYWWMWSQNFFPQNRNYIFQ
jgi:hypothetical protein